MFALVEATPLASSDQSQSISQTAAAALEKTVPVSAESGISLGTSDQIRFGDDREQAPAGFVRLPARAPHIDMYKRFVALQEWEGCVSEVDEAGGVFYAGLIDLKSEDDAEAEEGEFPLTDVQEYDRDLVRPGAYFRWVVGYRYFGRSRERSSRVVFRRLPAWTENDLAAAAAEARELAALIRGS